MRTRLVRSVVAAIMLLWLGIVASPVFAGFLQFPLHGCSNPSCTDSYTIHGAYSIGSINSVLDHSMKQNPNDGGYYPYGRVSTGGGNGKITAFNGEVVNGTPNSDDRCVGGTIYIHPSWNPYARMTNDSGCGSGYSSYDEHPGYDYYATNGTPVYAAASGTVISTVCYLGNFGSGGTCSDWGAIAINHGNGYFSQYLHMNAIPVVPGQYISAGQQIGTVSNKCYGCSVGYHLHFEVRHIGPTIGSEVYPVVDPYGWVGGGTDPLYSAPYVTPANLWQ